MIIDGFMAGLAWAAESVLCHFFNAPLAAVAAAAYAYGLSRLAASLWNEVRTRGSGRALGADGMAALLLTASSALALLAMCV